MIDGGSQPLAICEQLGQSRPESLHGSLLSKLIYFCPQRPFERKSTGYNALGKLTVRSRAPLVQSMLGTIRRAYDVLFLHSDAAV